MKVLSALLLLILASGARAGEGAPSASRQAAKAAELMALMEFVGGWEKHDGKWIDAMSLDTPDDAKNDSGEDHDQ